MKRTIARKWQGLLGLGLVIAVLAGCIGTIHGGGVISLLAVDLGTGPGVLADANVAVSVICNEKRDAVLSTIHWTDNANGVNFTAHLPWTPITEIFGVAATCEEAAQIVSEQGASYSVGLINSQGQESGFAEIGVTVPGGGPDGCGGLQEVAIHAEGPAVPTGFYTAVGCLDRGKITFQTP